MRFDPAVGDEIRKLRPAVVISVPDVGILKVRLVVPLTDWKPHYNEYIWITAISRSLSNGLSKLSAADVFPCKSASFDRFEQRLGSITLSDLREIVSSVGVCIGL